MEGGNLKEGLYSIYIGIIRTWGQLSCPYIQSCPNLLQYYTILYNMGENILDRQNSILGQVYSYMLIRISPLVYINGLVLGRYSFLTSCFNSSFNLNRYFPLKTKNC